MALAYQAEPVFDVAAEIGASDGGRAVRTFRGDSTDVTFRHEVFETMRHDDGAANICVAAVGIIRDDLAVRVNKEKGKPKPIRSRNF